MKVLIIHSTPWNDVIFGNNVLSNWFEGMDIEIANVYRGNEKPHNRCCTKYFQLTDGMMLRSLFGGRKAGIGFEASAFGNDNSKNEQTIGRLKLFSCEIGRAHV